MTPKPDSTHPNAEAFPAGLSGPALRALAHAGIRSMAQLAQRTEQEIAALHGMGPKGLLNRESYDAIAVQWEALRTALSTVEQHILDLLLEGLAAGSTVLDLGCGTGSPIATHLVSRGYRVCGVDQSAEMLAFAKKRLPTETWVHSALERYAYNNPSGAAIAWDSLFHIPRAEHATLFTRLRRALPAGGRFALTAGGSDQPAFVDSMLDRQFYYDSHPPAVTASLLERAGFRILHHEFLNLPDGGRDKGRIAIVAEAQ